MRPHDRTEAALAVIVGCAIAACLLSIYLYA